MIRKEILLLLIFLVSPPLHSHGAGTDGSPPDSTDESRNMDAFTELSRLDWKPVFTDNGTGDWKENWFLDGTRAKVLNTGDGMDFFAGPVPAEDASHSVLWTRRTFRGDLRIDYEYTRLDSATRYVNILYLLASGSGADGYPEDITEWSGKRTVPAMGIYYNHMNLLHISYAAFENTNTGKGNDYIRARRYMPETGEGLKGTGLVPDYFRTGFFRTGERHRITVIKHGRDLFMHIRNKEGEMICHWDLAAFPPLLQGRVGLRHMGSRAARYGNFRVYELGTGDKKGEVPVFNVLDYGAAGDGKTLDSPAIQKAIDDAGEAGEGARVLVPGGHRYLVGTLKLPGDIDFHLEEGAELYVSTNPDDYVNRALIMAEGARDLTISGRGNINGRALEFMSHYDEKDEWWRPSGWRPKIFVLTSCTNLVVRDISFSKAPSWGLHMLGCEHVLVDNIRIRNHLDVPNCDGIDPDHCRNVEIRNCHIICGDDAVVIKTTRQEKDYGPSAFITVSDCILETQDSGLKIGTETTADIHDILFERCEIRTSCRGLTIQLRDQGDVYNVVFRDIDFTSRYHSDPWWGRGEAISLTAIPRTAETKVGTIHDILLQNIAGKAENSVRISGTPESRIRNVKMENVRVKLDRWTKYKGGLFDNRPTRVYPGIETHGNPGFSIRYADDVVLERCEVSWGKNLPDYFTNALEAVEVTNLDHRDFKGKAAHPERDEAVVIR